MKKELCRNPFVNQVGWFLIYEPRGKAAEYSRRNPFVNQVGWFHHTPSRIKEAGHEVAIPS